MSTQLERIQLSCDDNDIIRFSWSGENAATIPASIVARSPHIHNIIKSNDDVQSIWVPEGSTSVWVRYVAQSDDHSREFLSRSSVEDLIMLLKACDFFADDQGVTCVSRELGRRLFPLSTQRAKNFENGSHALSRADSLASEASSEAQKGSWGGSGLFWTTAWKTCWSPRAPLEQRQQHTVSSTFKGLETLSIPLAISIIKGSLASLGKCLHQLPENYHPLVLLAHFPAIEAEKALLINRGTLQNEFTADTLQYLFDAALKMPTISTLDVSINNLFAHAHMLVTDNVARSFQRALCHFNLEYLAVDGDLLTDPVVMAIAEEIPRQTKLHSIVLARNRWHTPVFSLSAQFFNAVQQCTSLQHLELTEFRGEECVSSWELFKSPLAAALLALPNLRSLSLTRKSIATSDLLALHAKAEQHQQLLPELRSLDLSYNQLGASGARALAPVLSQLSSLEKLKLSMNGCGAQINMPVSSTRRRPSGELSGDGLEALATVFGTLKKLKHIDVTGNPYLSNQGAAALSAAWSGLSNVEHLDMNNCHAFPKGSVSVCSVVSCFTQLTYLDLTSFSLVDGYGNCAGARALADALTHHSSLQHLFLAGTQLTADAVVALAPSISHQRQLQTLDLQFDIEIASRGVIVLSQHISSLSNLRSLALACLDASEEAASALAASLSAVSALRSLNLCHFRTSSDGTDFLCDAFPRLIHLQDLLLADFGHFPASGVAKAVKSMPKLRKLNIGSNPIGDADSRALSTSIQSATSLEWLNVSAQVNICSKSGLEHFIQALDGHPSLQTCILSVADYLELAEELRQPWVRLQ